MDEKTTDDLRQELMSDGGLDAYLTENKDIFTDQNLGELLSRLYDKKSVSKAALARESGMSEVYLHQVFSGRRRPSRDRLLCLCAGLEADFEECQQLLKQAGYAQLYPRSRRDAIISYGIIHRAPLEQINAKLTLEREKPLF